jgi:hypothetical protein
MNRMVFALQDLGWHLDTVDTDAGRIVASMPRQGKSAGDEDAGAGKFYKILVLFPESPDTPVNIEPEDKADTTYGTGRFLKMVSEIKKRFAWYGGNAVEVVE